MTPRALAATFAVLALSVTGSGAKTFSEMFPQHNDLEAGEARDFLESLDYQQGKIGLRGGFADLQVPERYYFLGPADAEKVLTEAWENPPQRRAASGHDLSG
jgi:hypothetical protein